MGSPLVWPAPTWQHPLFAKQAPMACAVEHPDVACADNYGRDTLLVVGGVGENVEKVVFGIDSKYRGDIGWIRYLAISHKITF